jgi:hypothetical protein
MHAGQDHADHRRQALISYRISEDSRAHHGAIASTVSRFRCHHRDPIRGPGLLLPGTTRLHFMGAAPPLSKVQSVDQRMRLECGVGFRQKATSTGTDDCIMKLLVR